MDGKTVKVWATGDATLGELVRGRLEAEGIPVLLKGDGEGPYRAGPMYLWVDEADEARARAVLDAVESGAFALPEDEDVDEQALGTQVSETDPAGG